MEPLKLKFKSGIRARIINGRKKGMKKYNHAKIAQAQGILSRKKSLIAKMLTTARENWA